MPDDPPPIPSTPPPTPLPPRVRHDPPHPIATCATCRFRAPDSTCRRHAPQRLAAAPEAVWPIVALSDYCGKYEPGHPGDTHA